MSSKTYRLVKRILKKLSSKTKRSLLTLLPIAIITGLIDLLVVALVSRVFSAVVGQENRPPIPFSDLITTDPLTKAVLLISAYVTCNWIASFSRLLLRAKQEKLRASVFLELSNIAQKNVLTQNYDFFLLGHCEDSGIVWHFDTVILRDYHPIRKTNFLTKYFKPGFSH